MDDDAHKVRATGPIWWQNMANTMQGCYIFKPAIDDDEDIDPRPQKKRKLNKAAPKPDDGQDAWPRLLSGEESEENARLRKRAI